jgi:hypothetical protein
MKKKVDIKQLFFDFCNDDNNCLEINIIWIFQLLFYLFKRNLGLIIIIFYFKNNKMSNFDVNEFGNDDDFYKK